MREKQFQFQSLRWMLRHPKWALMEQIKWRSRPAIGDTVDYHGRIRKVVAFGGSQDDLILSDGSHASWMDCCNYPTEKEAEEAKG